MSIKRLNTNGDTIIEVLIALAILSFTLVTCYSILNRSLIAARNSQEHSEALEYLNSQIELTRSITAKPELFNRPGSFCVDNTGVIVDYAAPPAVPSACTVGIEGFYDLAISHSTASGQDVFTYQVTWPGPGSLGPQKEVLSYKLYPVVLP